LESRDGPWQQQFRAKYKIHGSILSICHKQNDSAIWSDLLKVKDIYLQGRKMAVGNGKRTDFWQDSWCGDAPLSIILAQLFEISLDVGKTVVVLANSNWSLRFRRWLPT
jgi:hypothetical protein